MKYESFGTSEDTPEERAAMLVLRFLGLNHGKPSEEATEELQAMIADEIRAVIIEERKKLGKKYHYRPGEKLKIACLRCANNSDEYSSNEGELCPQCKGEKFIRVPVMDTLSIGVRKVREGEREPYLVLEDRPELFKYQRILNPLLNEQRDATIEYCVALFDDLAKRIESKECFSDLDDDEYSRKSFVDAIHTYTGHLRYAKNHRRK